MRDSEISHTIETIMDDMIVDNGLGTSLDDRTEYTNKYA